MRFFLVETSSRPSLPLSALALVAALGFLGGLVGAAVVRAPEVRGPNGGSTGAGPPPLPLPEGPRTSESDRVVAVVEAASPAVVSVIVTRDLPKLEDVLLDPFGDPFFGPSPFRFRARRPTGEVERREIGGGTGFVVSADGLILTNRHVVAAEDADYTVLFNTGENVPARVLARDPSLDLAVLKVDRASLPTIPLKAEDDLRVGEKVIAIGNALGEFRNTVSVGVISGLGRQVVAGDRATGQAEVLDQVIQTDAAVNPGNSGGPLLNLRGEAVGINTAIAGGAENIGFALPASEAARALADVRAHGRVRRPFLGVRYVLVTPALASARRLPRSHGALVVAGEAGAPAVVPGSPADRAGIREEDLLLSLDGERIDTDHSLASLIRGKKVGERVTLVVFSRGGERTVEVTLEETR